MSRNRSATTVGIALSLAIAGYTGAALAGGFQLFEQSPSQLGNAFAGSAASAEDASTVFANPAGMTRLPGKQAVIGVNGVRPSAKFSNEGAHLNAPLGAIALTGGNGGDAGTWSAVPNLYFSWELTPQWFIGIGINSPFGLITEYDPTWVGRYQGIKSDLLTVNINPSIAYKVNDVVSLGVGVSAQYVDADLTKAMDFGTICFGAVSLGLGPGPCTILGITPQLRDGAQELEATNWGYGVNLGALLQISPDMRIGIAYRSPIKHTLEGDSKFSNVPGVLTTSSSFQNSSASARVTLPESVSLSVFQQFNEQWAIMGDITWTRWSRFDELRIKFANGAPDNVTPENWDDTFRIALGISYQVNSAWKLRGGVAYDQSPVSDQWRTVRIPDNDRTWVAVGASWAVWPNATLDFGYAHLFVKDAPINKSETAAGTVIGTYSNTADVLSLGLSYRF